MCGINGFIAKGYRPHDQIKSEISQMNNLIYHRGPDDDGIHIDSFDDFHLALGMRRLSIIDLETGKQPIYSNNRQLVISYNGEIYNYPELRNELISNGIEFTTHSDTEVILKLYETEGVASFKKLDGMYAFSIYDKTTNKVYLARDFFGEKPLYYTANEDGIIWGSELKSVVKKLNHRPEINPTALNLYFALTYIPAPYTIYQGVHKLEANSYIEYDLVSHNYAIFPIDKEENGARSKNSVSFTKAKQDVRDLVFNSVVSRSVSDVPIGTFLSGGVDSSVVSLCLSQFKSDPISTFSIGFEKKTFDETDKSRVVAKLIGSNHHEFIIGEKDLQQNVEEILLNFDEPFADSSCLPTFLVSQKTREHVKVALTGDGGDEVFGGYNKYYIGKMNNSYTSIVPQGIHRLVLKYGTRLLRSSSDSRSSKFRINRLLDSIDYDGGYYWDIISLGFTQKSLSEYLLPIFHANSIFSEYISKTSLATPSSLTDYRLIDKHISLDGDMLVKVDRTSMLNSLECRAPFLNKQIWNYCNQLPENFLMKGWRKKYILKEAFREDFPKAFLDQGKSGFGVPVGDWLKSSLRTELESYSDKTILLKQNIFNPEAITKLVKEHLSGKNDNTFKVWTFYCFQKWYFRIYEKI